MRRLLLAMTALGLALVVVGDSGVEATGNLELITSRSGNTFIGNRVWDPRQVPVTFVYNDPSTGVPSCNYLSTTAPFTALLAEVQSGFNTWQSVPDTTISFTYGGTTAVRNVALDGVNVVTFCSNTAFAPGVLGSTPSFAISVDTNVVAGGGCPAGQGPLQGVGCFPVGFYLAGTMVDAQVDINTSNPANAEQSLSTGTQAGLFGLDDLLVHEIGHFFGLSHDPIPDATMFPFIDDLPESDGLGQHVLKTTDMTTTGRYYPGAGYTTNYGQITGTITINGARGEAVHVFAVDPLTHRAVAGAFSVSRFEDPLAYGPEGDDLVNNGAGFFRIGGLPAGDYLVAVEYFDDSDFFTGRLANRYNTTVNNSTVASGTSDIDPNAQAPVWLGFLPQLVEFYDANESGDGGDGTIPGSGSDNSDAAMPVTVTAGNVTSGVDIDINIRPGAGLPLARSNPTTRVVRRNDNLQATDRITVFVLDGGNNDWYAVRFPAAVLPTPPCNVAEGIFIRGGKADMPMTTALAFEDPLVPGVPDFDDPVVSSAGRYLTGGPNGAIAAGDFLDVRDQWNVTVTTARDVWILLKQPNTPGGISFITQGYFYLVTCIPGGGGACTGNRVGNTFVTQNGGASFANITNGDLFYDLVTETAPPVMITATNPPSLGETKTGNIQVQGFGFQPGATVDFGPGVTVNNVTFQSSFSLVVNITIANTGATASRLTDVTVTNPQVRFPNVARVFTIDPFFDADGDGIEDSLDCAPGDPTLKQAAGLLMDLTVTDLGGSTQIDWADQDPVAGTGTVYDIATGMVGDLIPDSGFASAVCEAEDFAAPSYLDLNPDPPVGAARWWLGRAWNACNPAPGSYGAGTSGIMPEPRLLLDGGTPCAN